MASNLFLSIQSGVTKLLTAISSSSGVADANKIVATGSDGRIDNTLMPVGIGVDTKTFPSSENLSAGNYVNIWDDTGTLKVRKADASNGRAANGFVLAAVTSPNNATVYLRGENTQVSGRSIGPVWLSNTVAGEGTQTPPTYNTGDIMQILGFSTAATSDYFEYDSPVEVG